MMTTETTETSVKIVRQIGAPVDRVWGAFSDEQTFASWFRPGTRTCRFERFEFREGGSFQLAFEPTEEDGYGGPSPAHGVFQRIKQMEEIVMTWNWDFPEEHMREPESRLVFRLRSTGTGTEVTLLHEGLSGKRSVEGHTGGWQTVLPKLEKIMT